MRSLIFWLIGMGAPAAWKSKNFYAGRSRLDSGKSRAALRINGRHGLPAQRWLYVEGTANVKRLVRAGAKDGILDQFAASDSGNCRRPVELAARAIAP